MESWCDLSGTIYYEEQGVRIGNTQAGKLTNEVHDCSVIAVAVSADVPYQIAHELLRKWGRKNNSYTPRFYHWCRLGPFQWRRCVKRTRTIKTFIKHHPTGRYIILLRPHSHTCHVASVVNGTLYNCGIDSIKCIVFDAWKFEGPRQKVFKSGVLPVIAKQLANN